MDEDRIYRLLEEHGSLNGRIALKNTDCLDHFANILDYSEG
jgi:hypothetical protein